MAFRRSQALRCPGVSVTDRGTALKCNERALSWAVLPPNWIFRVAREVSLALLFAAAAQVHHLTQIMRRKADVTRDPRDFMTAAFIKAPTV